MGRKRKVSDEELRELHSKGLTSKEIAYCSCNITTWPSDSLELNLTVTYRC